ncbi:G5 domain-containing protein [Polycladomyces sp. WAk]|uniref:G5 domain-containing protein n=1 Tax=Polycladomyces zharkentensis TaxID=2807616 RepID=A0ABS2WFX3_9BACL|nr:3D domain-containing protein [Polycladomyces sp. WAk]MBN2908433.1 G5 domain-containing protein [Polycladomyces sp. WAk]
MKKILLIGIGIVSILLLSGTLVYAMQEDVTITFSDKDHPLVTSVMGGTLEEALESEGYDIQKLKKKYIPSIPWNRTLSDNAKVQLLCQCRVQLQVGGEKTGTYTTRQRTVGQFLAERHIQLNRWDQVNAPLNAKITDNMLLVVDRIEKRIKKKVEVTPYKTVKKEDPKLEKGKEQVLKQGVKGKRIYEVALIYKNGKPLVTDERLIEEILPVHMLVAVGTGTEIPKDQEQKEDTQVAEERGSSKIAGMEYTKTMDVEATGYTSSGNAKTATGTTPRRGTIAVDPDVIPLGTKMYIPGYGVGVAEDTGGAVKGNIIDLYFESEQEAIQWGRRNVTIYILKD